MTSSAPMPSTPATPAVAIPEVTTPNVERTQILKDIHEKWSKFSDQDLSAITSTDDLVQKVSSKYGQDKNNAKIDVEKLLKGRAF